MPRYDKGDVVLVHFPWIDAKGDSQAKSRPGVVLSVEADQVRLIIQITSKNRSNKLPGKWVLAKSHLGIQMGIRLDSFINYTEQAQLQIRDIKRKIGYCSIIEQIEDEIENLS